MIGAIAGDVIGSVYEFNRIKTKRFVLFSGNSGFTDDTVMTVAAAEAILYQREYVVAFREWGRKYPDCGWGQRFGLWLFGPGSEPYGSYGNGSAMRISPVGFAFNTLEETIIEATRCAEVTHNHPEGIKGAQAVAAAIFMARKGSKKDEIKKFTTGRYGYDLDRTIAGIRKNYRFDETCQGSVPESIIAFLESKDWEDAVRLAVSLGGDSDTQACIAGGIAQAFYGGVPDDIVRETRERLAPEMRAIVDEFKVRYGF
jgi:ADP-ribosylglycohydrolase